ncbi:MAG: MAPEG family protein [Pseudomonadota bacterium]
MTIELTYLTLTTLLAASLWIPFVIGVNTTTFERPEENRPPDPAAMSAWVHRAYRAHLNLMEQFPPFAAIVLVAHMAGVSTMVTVVATAAFFWLRLAQAIWMVGDFPQIPVRPIIFTSAWICILLIGWQIIAA